VVELDLRRIGAVEKPHSRGDILRRQALHRRGELLSTVAALVGTSRMLTFAVASAGK